MVLEGEGVKIGLCQITEKSEELDSFQLMEASSALGGLLANADCLFPLY